MSETLNATEECAAIFENFTVIEEKIDFVNTPSLNFIKNFGFRYGYTENITAVINGDEDGSDYLKGLIATNITFFIIFIVWILLVFVLKCGCGSKRVGGLSGRIYIPPKPIRSEYDGDGEKGGGGEGGNEQNAATGDYLYQQDVEKWDINYKKQKRNHKIAVWTIVFSGLCIVTFAILMSIEGVQSLVKSLDNGIDTLTHVQDLTVGGIALIDTVLEGEDVSESEVLKFLEATNSICGSEVSLCTNITDVTTCDLGGLESVISESVLQEFIIVYDNRRDAIYADLRQAKVDLIDIYDVAGNVAQNAQNFNWAFQAARVFALVLAGLCLLIIHGVLFNKWTFAYKCLRNCILIPLFVILVLLCYLFSLIFVMGSKSLGDVCYNSPDPNMLLLLNRFQSSFSPILYKAIVFYINQCPLQDVPADLTDTIAFLFTAIQQILAFITTLGSIGNDALQAICQGEAPGNAASTVVASPKPVIELAESAKIKICELVGFLLSIGEYLQCDNWLPLYTTTIWEAMCTNGTDGFLWVSVCQLGIVVFSMVLLTARVGFFEFPNVEDENDGSNSEGDKKGGDNGSHKNNEEEGYNDGYDKGVKEGGDDVPPEWQTLQEQQLHGSNDHSTEEST